MKLTFSINKEIIAVMDFLTQPEKFVSVHPLIYKLELLRDGSYKVYEKVNKGMFSYAFTYNALISKKDQENEVLILVNVKSLVKIKMLFKLHSLGNFTQIEELVEIETFLPVKKMMFRLLETQHQVLFKNIENRD